MPNFKEIVDQFVSKGQFAGGEPQTPEEIAAEQKKREMLTKALNIRKQECVLRGNIAIALLLIATGLLVYLSLAEPQGIKKFKELMSALGGGSIIAMLLYVISVREDLVRTKQGLVLAAEADSATLNTMLITLSTK